MLAEMVRSGFFPTSPLEPRIAVSIEFLDFYLKLHESSGDAITGVALALKDFYATKGIRATDIRVCGHFIYCLNILITNAY